MVSTFLNLWWIWPAVALAGWLVSMAGYIQCALRASERLDAMMWVVGEQTMWLGLVVSVAILLGCRMLD